MKYLIVLVPLILWFVIGAYFAGAGKVLTERDVVFKINEKYCARHYCGE